MAVSVAAVAGCKHDGPGAGSPGEPSSTQDQDALWQLAPPGAKVGAVLSSRGVTMLEHGALAIRALFDLAPDLAPLKQQLDAGLRKELGSATPMLGDYGLGHDKGLAIFMAADESPVFVLPVVDRAKFVAKLHGTTAGDTDTFHNHPCKQLGAHYVCAEKPEMFAQLGKGGLDAARKAIAARGDFELVVTGIGKPGSPEGGGSIQLASGAFLARGVISHVPDDVTRMIGAPIDGHGDASAAGFGVFNLAPYLALVPADVPLGNGVTMSDLAGSIAGSISLTAPAGAHRIELHIPLRDTGPAKALIEHCTKIFPLIALGATQNGAACRVPVPKSGMTVEAVVANHEIQLTSHIGGHDGDVARLPATSIGALIAGAPWTMAMYGRGSVLAVRIPKEATAELQSDAAVAFRALSLLNEIGAAMRKDGSNVSFVFGARSIWSNPDDVVAKLIAVSPDQILAGSAVDTGRKIAEATPSAPFASDYRAGIGGAVVATMPIGVIAAIAIPSFMDYMKRSKKTEAELQLHKIAKNAKRAFAETGAFPKGDVGPTPSATCCSFPDHHCASKPSDWQVPVWGELDFAISEPHLYQYSYSSDGKSFVAKATGDLACSGSPETYEMRGTLENGSPHTELVRP